MTSPRHTRPFHLDRISCELCDATWTRHDFQLDQPLPHRAQPRDGAQCGFHFAPAGFFSRSSHAAQGRQCGGRGDRRCRGTHHRRAHLQRPGQRQLRHPLGRQRAAWPELVGRGTGHLEHRLLCAPSRRPDAPARLGLGHHARRRGGLGGLVRSLPTCWSPPSSWPSAATAWVASPPTSGRARCPC